MARPVSREDLAERIRRDFRRSFLRGRHAIQYVTGTQRPELETTPRDTVWSRDNAKLYRFRGNSNGYSPPLLLVHSLVTRSYIFDLTPEMSFVGTLRDAGFDVFLLDWSTPEASDSGNTLETYVDVYIREAAEVTAQLTGSPALTVLGYCFGGDLALLHCLRHPQQVENLILMATPIDFEALGVLSEVFKEGRISPDMVIDETGNVPASKIENSFKLLRPTGTTIQYASLWQHLWDDQYVAGYQAINQWVGDHVPFPGAAFRQVVALFMQDNAFMSGTIRLGGISSRLDQITCPLLNVYAERDYIVPIESSEPAARLVGSPDIETLQIPGGHASLATGRQAAKVTLPGIIDWLRRHSEERQDA